MINPKTFTNITKNSKDNNFFKLKEMNTTTLKAASFLQTHIQFNGIFSPHSPKFISNFFHIIYGVLISEATNDQPKYFYQHNEV